MFICGLDKYMLDSSLVPWRILKIQINFNFFSFY